MLLNWTCAIFMHAFDGKYCVVFVAHFSLFLGHMEKAIAAFQALIEFNCFFPKCLGEDLTTVTAVSFFENFWDSDLPRLKSCHLALHVL